MKIAIAILAFMVGAYVGSLMVLEYGVEHVDGD